MTAGGKNIAPQPIEGLLKTNAYLAEVVVVGNKRNFASGSRRAGLRQAHRLVPEPVDHDR